MARYEVVVNGHRLPVCGLHLWDVLGPLEAAHREPDLVRPGNPEQECPLCLAR